MPWLKTIALTILYGAIAQLGERLICIQEVRGSIPRSSTTSSKNENTKDYILLKNLMFSIFYKYTAL